MKLVFSLFILVAALAAPSVVASEAAEFEPNHHGHWDVHCYARNIRGNEFQGEAIAYRPGDRWARRRAMADAMSQCRRVSLGCYETGCHEHYHY